MKRQLAELNTECRVCQQLWDKKRASGFATTLEDRASLAYRIGCRHIEERHTDWED